MTRQRRSPAGSTLEERLLFHSAPDASGCRLWVGGLDTSGYGGIYMRIDGRANRRGAHRMAYQVWKGPIPEGMTVDHICFQRACINPDHLRLLSLEENSRQRRAVSPTHCPQGHELTAENLAYWRSGREVPSRRCRTCRAENLRKWREGRAA